MEEERTTPTEEEEAQALGLTPEVLAFLRRTLATPALLGEDTPPAQCGDALPDEPAVPMEAEDSQAAEALARQAAEAREAVTARQAAEARQASLAREESEIAALWPGFGLEDFRAAHPEEAAALDAGAGLWPTAVPALLATAREGAERAVVERIRRRNAGLPRPLAASPDAAPADYTAMSSEAFARARADFERRMREGQHVRP